MPNPSTTRRASLAAALLWLAVTLCAAFYGATSLLAHPERIDTDILHLLPRDGEEHRTEARIADLVASMSGESVILVGHAHADTATLLADTLAARLRASPLFASVIYQDYASLEKDFYTTYFPSRSSLLTTGTYVLLDSAGSSAQLSQHTLAQLTSLMGGMVANLLPRDPLLLFPTWLQSLRNGQEGVSYRQGALWISHDSTEFVLIRAQLRGNAFAASTQDSLASLWQSADSALHRIAPSVQIPATGTWFFARHGRLAAQSEMSFIGTGSMLAVLLLFLWLFRGPRHLLVGMVPIVAGMIMGLAAGLWAFHNLHALTLVMGMSLIGICVDYSFHYFVANRTREGRSPLQRIFPSIAMGMVTTLFAYVALGLSGFPGLQQIALFGGVGVFSSFLSVVLWYPWLLTKGTTPATRIAWLGNLLSHWPRLIRSRTGLVLVALALIAAALGVAIRQQTLDDIRMFQNMDPALRKADSTVQSLLGRFESNRFYLVSGQSVEQVLQRQEALGTKLEQQMLQGHIRSYTSYARFVPSLLRQQKNHARLAQWSADTLAWNAYANSLGLALSLRDSVPGPFVPLTPANLNGTALSRMLPPLSQGPDSLWQSPVLLQGITDAHTLQVLASLPGVEWIDRVQSISAMFARFRALAARMLAIANVLVLVALCLRYGLGKGLRAMLPPLASVLLTLGVQAWIGMPVQFFTILAFTLVLGAGVDYTIFLVEDADNEDHGTWAAVFLSSVTTLLSFGLLAFSGTAALASFGLTVLLGCAFCFLLAPLGVSPRKKHHA